MSVIDSCLSLLISFISVTCGIGTDELLFLVVKHTSGLGVVAVLTGNWDIKSRWSFVEGGT